MLAINKLNQTLEKWYNDVKLQYQNFDEQSEFSYGLNTSQCIENILRISENQNLYLNFAEAMILIYGSGLECMYSKESTFRQMTESLINSYKKIDHLYCFKLEMHKIYPNSNLLKKFDASKFEDQFEICNEIIDNNGFEENLKNIEASFGNISNLTCNAINRDDFKKILLKIILIANTSKKNKEIAGPRMTNLLLNKMNAAYTCVKNNKLIKTQNNVKNKTRGKNNRKN